MPIVPPSSYVSNLTSIAVGEYAKYHGHQETDKMLSARIREYYHDLGIAFQSVGVAWSAVFVSWCMKQAGATAAEFEFSSQHSVFVYRAIRNQLQAAGKFRGRKVAEYAPKLGDIIHMNRENNHFDYDYARQHADYHSHSAIVVQLIQDGSGHYAVTTGGNEGNSVGQRKVMLDQNGLIVQPADYPSYYISVIEDIK